MEFTDAMRRKESPCRDVLVDLYSVKLLTKNALASMYEVSPKVVDRWLREAEIPVRGLAQAGNIYYSRTCSRERISATLKATRHARAIRRKERGLSNQYEQECRLCGLLRRDSPNPFKHGCCSRCGAYVERNGKDYELAALHLAVNDLKKAIRHASRA